MGDCQCSNITIMQLFHELKQQFPALPDHVVSQCIAQNSHDRETCARSLRLTQNSRPSPGAFPPPPPPDAVVPQHCSTILGNKVGSRIIQNHPHPHQHTKAHRPVSLDIGPPSRQCSTSTRCRVLPPLPTIIPSSTTRPAPSSAPATYSTRGFFDELQPTNVTSSSPVTDNYSGIRNLNSSTAGFEVNVNVACSPAGNRDFRTVQSPGSRKSDSNIVESRSHFTTEPRAIVGGNESTIHPDHARSYTSVSLTLRPPSSEPQPPIDIRSQGSSLTYSTSSLNQRGFQSRLQISIGPGNVGSVAAARIRPPMSHPRPNSLINTVQSGHQRPPGLPAGPPSQLPRPTTTMSAPSTPSVSATGIVTSSSLPTTPLAVQQASTVTTSLPPSPIRDSAQISTELNRSPSTQVAERQRRLIAEQLIRKERLAKKLAAEKGRLEAMKSDLQAFLRPMNPNISPEDLKRRLRSEIYQLQVECDILTREVDKRSDPRVPLGETNEEFYQGIYTGQSLNLPSYRNSSPPPPPLPSVLPAWEVNQNSQFDIGENDDDKDGPSWVCGMCTFNNHPLMDQCEQCGMPRFPSLETGETQDIHIRVTHHHNFSPRRTVHSWVV